MACEHRPPLLQGGKLKVFVLTLGFGTLAQRHQPPIFEPVVSEMLQCLATLIRRVCAIWEVPIQIKPRLFYNVLTCRFTRPPRRWDGTPKPHRYISTTGYFLNSLLNCVCQGTSQHGSRSTCPIAEASHGQESNGRLQPPQNCTFLRRDQAKAYYAHKRECWSAPRRLGSGFRAHAVAEKGFEKLQTYFLAISRISQFQHLHARTEKGEGRRILPDAL